MSFETKRIDIAAFDTNPLLASGISMLFGREPGFSATALHTEPGSDLALPEVPSFDVVLIDPTQTGLPVAQIVQHFRTLLPAVALIGYCSDCSADLARSCIAAGFQGFLPKTASYDALKTAVIVVASGGVYLDVAYAQAVFGPESPASRRATVTRSLTEREIYVLKSVAHGKSLKEIGHELELSSKTIETYKARGASKLNLSGRREIVAFAIQNGWVQAAH
ncbi:MAG: response regulator transcription factor [Paracoccaceae bacterium]